MNTILLNIQYFATQITDVNHTGTSGLSDGMKTYYHKNLIKTIGPNLIHDQVCEKKDIPLNSGKSIEFRRYDDLDASIEAAVLRETEIPTGQALTETAITATIGEYGRYVKVSDTLDMTSIDQPVLNAQEKTGQQAAMISDKITREVLNEGTNVLYANGGTSRHTLTVENTLHLTDIFKMAAMLRGDDVPKFGDAYIAIIHPHISYDLMTEVKEPAWIDVNKYTSNEKILDGELGKIGGVRFLETSNAKIFRGDDLGLASRTLSATAFSGGTLTVSGAKENLKGRYVIVSGSLFYVSANTATTLTLKDPDDHATAATGITIGSGATVTVYPGEGAAEGISVYSTLICGKGGASTTGLGGAGVESIIHNKNEIGGPLNQFSTVGWKLRKTAEILVDKYIGRIESCSAVFTDEPAN